MQKQMTTNIEIKQIKLYPFHFRSLLKQHVKPVKAGPVVRGNICYRKKNKCYKYRYNIYYENTFRPQLILILHLYALLL